MTILADHTDTSTTVLSSTDILDAADALHRLNGHRVTHINPRDRQALTLLTYLDELPPYLRNALAKFVTGEATWLPSLAARLIQRHLPAVSDQDWWEWRSQRQAEPAPADQIIAALAGHSASRSGEFGSGILDGALQTAIRVGRPSLPLHEVPATAARLVAGAMLDLDADGLTPPAQGNPVQRALRIIAAEAARRSDSTADALRWAMRTLAAEMAHSSPTPIPDETQHDAYRHVEDLVEQARCEQQMADYDEAPVAVTR
ncbi:hypothetical protein ACIBG4_40440 [Nonomuraea sp. NPDC050383]|uniref:hypothetical protein n=1 Tax=Nonomuraea sp. NPDC050383 TaxID=3364362 RepID=UPI00379E4145